MATLALRDFSAVEVAGEVGCWWLHGRVLDREAVRGQGGAVGVQPRDQAVVSACGQVGYGMRAAAPAPW